MATLGPRSVSPRSVSGRSVGSTASARQSGSGLRSESRFESPPVTEDSSEGIDWYRNGKPTEDLLDRLADEFHANKDYTRDVDISDKDVRFYYARFVEGTRVINACKESYSVYRPSPTYQPGRDH